MYLKRGTFVRAFVLLATSAAFLIADAHAAPKDPPVTSGGEGPTGNDWTDYGYASPSTLYYRRNGENYRVTNHTTVYISTTNSNFNLNHCRISTPVDVAKVSHYHFAKDYGDNFGGANGVVTAQEGKDFFDWQYAQYGGAWYSYGGATTVSNCVCYAYHKTRGDNTLTYYWVDPGDADKYRNQLFKWAEYGDNGDFDTCPLNRCDDIYHHVWIIDSSPGGCAASSIRWKNNSSGTYLWNHPIYTNDCPKGNRPSDTLYGNYAIYDESP